MSIARDDGTVVNSGTTGIMTFVAREANEYANKVREANRTVDEMKNKGASEYIRALPTIHRVLQGRINGVPLNQLLPAEKITNNNKRMEEKPEVQEQNEKVTSRESWFWDR